LKHETISELPIRMVSQNAQQPIIDLVDAILLLNKDSDYFSNLDKHTKIEDYERQIDRLIYELYGLTVEEVAMIASEGGK
ncbi:MAG: hypothetical protein V2A61_06860, partial [Calditrichota bacterium]